MSAWRDVLRGDLLKCRSLLEKAWNAETRHPDYGPAKDGSPVGQCGVTSRWLLGRLERQYGLQAMYCCGKVSLPYGVGEREHHCWVEIGEPDDHCRIIVDLTVDQFMPGLSPVVYDPWVILADMGIIYSTRSRHSEDELASILSSRRYLTLLQEIALRC